MFGLMKDEKKKVFKSELKRLTNDGYRIISKRNEYLGTRTWMIVEKNQIRSLALLSLCYFNDLGWVANTYHEDTGIPQMNCPEVLMNQFKLGATA